MEFEEKIVDAAKEIFETMIMREVKPGARLSDQVAKFRCSLSAIVGFAGYEKGNLAIHAPAEVAVGITRDFLGSEVEEIDDDVLDAMGELANMIAGSLKPFIANGGKDVELSLPSVVYGKEYSVIVVDSEDWISVPFAVSHGRFLVCLELKNHG